MKAVLALKDGTIFEGLGFGAEKEVAGEVVFNTSLVGYEESLTDPSYKGQILTLTYPLIGNYGVRKENFESDRIQVEGFVVREYQDFYSHRNAVKSINEFLKEFDIPGISGIDTRMLTKKIREHGVINGALVVSKSEIDKDNADGAKVGINGTPSFFVGKSTPDGTIDGTIIVGAQPYAQFKAMIDAELAK